MSVTAAATMDTSSESSSAQIREAERLVFKKWYATASIGAKLAYWQERVKRSHTKSKSPVGRGL